MCVTIESIMIGKRNVFHVVEVKINKTKEKRKNVGRGNDDDDEILMGHCDLGSPRSGGEEGEEEEQRMRGMRRTGEFFGCHEVLAERLDQLPYDPEENGGARRGTGRSRSESHGKSKVK